MECGRFATKHINMVRSRSNEVVSLLHGGVMTKYKGRSTRRLPDMSMEPAPAPEYRPPHGGDLCEYPISLDAEHMLLVRQVTYRGKIVDFAIMQFYGEGEAQREIARIDCCHGSIHRHRFDKKGNDVLDRDVIKEIVVGQDEWATVDAAFDSCMGKMQLEFMENYRRWAK